MLERRCKIRRRRGKCWTGGEQKHRRGGGEVEKEPMKGQIISDQRFDHGGTLDKRRRRGRRG